MSIDIFIRTYKGDLEWLGYCLRSIHKYAKGFRNIIVCIPDNQKNLLRHLTFEKVVTCPVYDNDYLGQQVSKMKADTYSDADNILFVDSDCVFLEEVDLNEYFENGKPKIYKTRYELVGDAICWKEVTQKAINKELQYEYMRRIPLMYKRETIKDAREFVELLHGTSIENFILSNKQSSEFNILGAYADNFTDDYNFIDTDKGVEKAKVKQFWSWGKVTSEIRKEIESVL